MNACASLLLLTLSGAIEVEVTPLRGAPIIGDVVELTSEHVTVTTSEGEQTFDSRTLLRVMPLDAIGIEDEDDLPSDRIAVELSDGSLIHAIGYRVADRRAWIEIEEGVEARASTRSVRAVRFMRGTEELDRQWQLIADSDATGDVIVLRKTQKNEATERVSVALDHLEGVLHDITQDTVGFEFDATRADVPRERVEGVRYFHRRTNPLREPICQLVDLNGSRWNIRSLKLAGEHFELTTSSGLRHKLAIDLVERLDYSLANLVYLSSLEPEAIKWKPHVESAVTPPTAQTFFRPQRDRWFYGGPMLIDGEAYDKGLAIHSHTVMSYRLTGEFDRLLATVAIDDRCRADGNVGLTISGNNDVLLKRPISGSDEPVQLDLDVTGVRRLTIEVDFGQDGVGLGDNLNLGDIRLTK